MSDEAAVSSIPKCDVCGERPAVYDGKTVGGPWAYMCESCWSTIGVGRLGTGYGQRLRLAPDVVCRRCGHTFSQHEPIDGRRAGACRPCADAWACNVFEQH